MTEPVVDSVRQEEIELDGIVAEEVGGAALTTLQRIVTMNEPRQK